MVKASLTVLPTVPDARPTPTRVKYLSSIDQIPGIPDADRQLLRTVSERYVFRANDYYLKLINWQDPNDPIKQLIIPRSEELSDWGKLDASNEAANTVEPGVQHKYMDTVLLLCNEVCGAYCRYCFRKRLFMNDNEEVSKDISAGLAYIRRHPEISNVLLTGGDPLILGTRRLTEIISALREIDHVKIIRIGSKMPAFNPFRIIDDADLQALFRKYSTPEKRIYLMCHIDHPRELTPEARRCISTLLDCGVVCVNQCPIIKGINDNQDTLAELFSALSYIGCPQYYCFQGRPTAGNEPYEVTLVQGWNIFSQALVRESGLAGRAKYCMSHASGKVEVVGIDDEHIYLRYHRSKYPENNGKFFVCRRNDDAFWLDHLTPVPGSYVPTGVTFGQPVRPDATAPGESNGQARNGHLQKNGHVGAVTHAPHTLDMPLPVTLPQSSCGSAFSAPCRGFTLIELLVSVSIIVLLIGILLPSLATARKAARATRETAALRQYGVGYSAYAQENHGNVMPGYLRGSWADPVKRKFIVHESRQDASEESRLTGSIIRPFTWRLMPYMDHSFEGMITDPTLLRTVESLTTDPADSNSFQLAFSRHPSFGMNTTYVGGDAHRGGFFAMSTRRWGAFYVTRIDQVRAASSLIIFTSSRGVRDHSGGEKVPGYHRIEGPWRATPTSNSVPAFLPWQAPHAPFDPDLPTSTYGHVDFRFSGKAATVAFDGHVDLSDLDQMRDMRRWCNLAKAANWQPR